MSQGNYKLLEVAGVPTGHLSDMTALLALRLPTLLFNPFVLAFRIPPARHHLAAIDIDEWSDS